MRFIALTVLSAIATPAFACGMYIPMDMKVASIGSLMDEVDIFEVAQEPVYAPQLAQAPQVVAPPITGTASVAEHMQIVRADDQGLTRKQRRAIRRAARAVSL